MMASPVRILPERRVVQKAALSSLVVGERIVSRCEDGLLKAEYALFDRSEVMLSTAGGQGVHEKGYLTTAGFARSRLEDAGLTADLAHAALGALRPNHLKAVASAPSVLRVVDRLGPYEAFEGGTFVAASGRYTGTWLDLEALGEAASREVSNVSNASGISILLQALHLHSSSSKRWPTTARCAS